MEAIKASRQGKIIYCIIDSEEHVYLPTENEFSELTDDDYNGISTKEILDGKWYIKESGKELKPMDKTKFIEINYKDLRDQERRTKYFATQEEYEEWHEENWDHVVIKG